jgi:hypothetical protein
MLLTFSPVVSVPYLKEPVNAGFSGFRYVTLLMKVLVSGD